MTTEAPTYTPPERQNLGFESSLSNWAGPFVSHILGRGLAQSEQPYEAYGGPLTAGASPLQQQAFTDIGNLGQDNNIPGITGFTGQSFTDEGVASAYMNPYLEQSLEPQIAQYRREADVSRQARNAQLTQAGAFGGSRQAIENSELDRNLLRGIADVRGRGYSDAFTQGRAQFNAEQDRALRANLQNNQLSRNILGQQLQAGNIQRDIESEGIAADKQAFEEERYYPWQQTQFLQSLLQNLPLEAQSQVLSDVNPVAEGLGSAAHGADLVRYIIEQFRT